MLKINILMIGTFYKMKLDTIKVENQFILLISYLGFYLYNKYYFWCDVNFKKIRILINLINIVYLSGKIYYIIKSPRCQWLGGFL